MNENIDILVNKLFKEDNEISLNRIKTFKHKITKELLYFSYNSMVLKENGKLSIEEFSKNILSNLKPGDAFNKIKNIDCLFKKNKIKGDISFNDYYILNIFFTEYKKYFKLSKTSNFSRNDFQEIFSKFTDEYKLKFDNKLNSINNLYSLIDTDENENLEYRELKNFLFKAGVGGRGDKKNEQLGIRPIKDLKKKYFILKDKLQRIIDIALE